MSARQSSQPSVQLFPFLAVLMCALGALILLLLVTAGRIRNDVRARVSQSELAAASARPQPKSKVPPPREHWRPSATLPAVTLHPQPRPDKPVDPPATLLREQWQRTVADLEIQVAALERERNDLQAKSADQEAELAKLEQQLAMEEEAARTHTERRTAAAARKQAAEARHQELLSAIERLQTEHKRILERQAEVASRYSVIPYDGRTGTVRRPIYIECTAEGLTFASEKIRLTADQLDGFTTARNPLRAGTEALIDYWTLKSWKAAGEDPSGAPYVLLIVRPGGTIAYYVARKMLQALPQPSGYELVPDDLQLEWPPSDPEAVAACRAAIDAVLQDPGRPPERGIYGPGDFEPLHIADGQGGFRLEEVDRLRGGGRIVHFGGRTFERSLGQSAHGSVEGSSPRPLPAPALSGRSLTGAPSASAPFERPQQGYVDVEAGHPFPHSSAGESASDEHNLEPRIAAPHTEASGGAAGGSQMAAAPPPLVPGDSHPIEFRQTTAPDPRDTLRSLRAQGSQIGLERKVIVRVEAARICVETEAPIEIVNGISREDLQAALAESLSSHFQSWGQPPQSFYWLPKIEFRVLPGGHQRVKRLTDLTDAWEIDSVVEIALE